jgi:2-haloalkanoic acid dehalogenase type II
VADCWVTFDCYGTLIDWDGGIRGELARLFGEEHSGRLLGRYHELEPEIQSDDPAASYRDVMARALEQLAGEEGLDLAPSERDALGRSLPAWQPFPEVRDALAASRERGFRLVILSNSDPDLIAASIEQLGVPFDDAITASEIGSYKPAHSHWRAFEQRRGRLPDIHVAASLFHDVGPADELGIPSVWVNRLGEEHGSYSPTRELRDLSPLPHTLVELAPR